MRATDVLRKAEHGSRAGSGNNTVIEVGKVYITEIGRKFEVVDIGRVDDQVMIEMLDDGSRHILSRPSLIKYSRPVEDDRAGLIALVTICALFFLGLLFS